MKPEGVALVTGASRGLGRALALEPARRGFEGRRGRRRSPEALAAAMPRACRSAMEG